MWWHVTLRNFRSIERADVQIAPFTLLVGPNASGKSNFVDALVLISRDAAAAVERRGGIAGVRRWSPSKPYDVTITARVADDEEGLLTRYTEYSATLKSRRGGWEFAREAITSLDPKGQQMLLQRKGTGVVMTPGALQRPSVAQELINFDLSPTTSMLVFAKQVATSRTHAHLRHMLAVRQLHLHPPSMRQPQIADDNLRLESMGQNVASVLRRLIESDGGTYEKIVAAMGRIVPGLKRLDVTTAGRYLALSFHQAVAKGDEAAFGATEMSEGSLRALGILTAAFQMRSGETLVIEEPEANIHPGAAAVLFEVLREASSKGCVVLTTHSPELLDEAKAENIVVCAYRDGVTSVGPLDAQQRSLVRDGLLSASELMRAEPLRIEGEAPRVVP
jgi:type I restriction enzyme M protein